MMTRRGWAATAIVLASAALAGCHDSNGLNSAAPTQMAMVSGDAQVGVVGRQLAEPFVVVVKNINDQPVQGVTVQFYVVTGGGGGPLP